MKKITLLILTLFFTSLSFSQKEYLEFYKRSHVVFEGCEDSDDLERCYDITFHEFLAKHINHKSLKDSILFNAKKDTITIHASILYDENGRVVKSHSNISSPLRHQVNATKHILDSIPIVKPVLDKYNNGVAYTQRNLFGFLLDKTQDSIVPILGYTPSEVPFAYIEKVPVYKGCDEDMTNEALKKCMNDKIVELISKNFKPNLAKKLKLDPGIQRIYVIFKIDKKGKVSDIRARGPHEALEKEAVRVIKKIPKLKKPGYQRGKPVIVPYSIPIVFRVTA